MALALDTLVQRLEDVNLGGIVSIERGTVGRESREVALVKFLRMKGAFREDNEIVITMIVDPDGPFGDLYFLAPTMDTCDPFDRDLTAYIDANAHTPYGAHRWEAAQEQGDVNFSYSLPLPEDTSDFPDAQLLQRILENMYISLLFYEVKMLQRQIAGDDMLSDDEKLAKIEKAREVFARITNPTDDAV